jgi:hypothetical protein
MRAAARAGVRLVVQGAERRQIVFECIDRLVPVGRRRPRERGARRSSGGLLQLVAAGDAPGHGAPHFERVERRHARPSLADFHGGKRDVQTRLGRSDRKAQLQFLEVRTVRLKRQPGVEPLPRLVQQQRILARLLRKHPLRQGGDEHDVEAAAAELRGTAHQDPAVPAQRCVGFDGGHPIREDPRRFVERDRSDGAHRPEVREHTQDAVRPQQHARRQRLEQVQPFGPRRLYRPRGQRPHDRQRERREMIEVVDLSLELRDPARLGFGAHELAALQLAFVRQPLEAALPPILTGHDTRLGQQAFPFPRRPKRAARRRVRPFRVDRFFIGRDRGLLFRALAESAEHLITRRRKRGDRAAGGGLRHLAQREVLGEPSRRQPVERAGDQGKKRAAGWMRAPCAALEVHRHAGALERVFQEPGIVLRRAERDRHAIERHAAASLAQDPARDFDRLAPFARRREQLDFVERNARRRHCLGKQVAADATETGGLAAIEQRWRRQRLERLDGRGIAGGDRHERVLGASDERVNERAFRRVGNRDVQQDEARGRRRMRGCPCGRRLGGDAQKGRTVNRRRRLKLPIEALEQIRQIAARLGQNTQRGRLDGSDGERFERTSQRAGESGHSRDRPEVRQRAVPIGIE